MRRHTTLGGCVVERKNGIGRATRFERANFLKIFALKKEGGSACFIQSRAREDTSAMDM
jgi:hypothetical protein